MSLFGIFGEVRRLYFVTLTPLIFVVSIFLRVSRAASSRAMQFSCGLTCLHTYTRLNLRKKEGPLLVYISDQNMYIEP